MARRKGREIYRYYGNLKKRADKINQEVASEGGMGGTEVKLSES